MTEVLYQGLDIIKLMIEYGVAERRRNTVAFSRKLNNYLSSDYSGLHAMEVRVYSENPFDGFKPCPGVLQHVNLSHLSFDWLRVETWVSTYYLLGSLFNS